MSIKINATALGIKKSIEVKESTKNVQRAMLLQKEFVNAEFQKRSLEEKEVDDVSIDDMNEKFEVNFGLIESINGFISKLLRLTDEQVEFLEEEVDQEDVMALASELMSKLLHLDLADDTEEVVVDKSLTD